VCIFPLINRKAIKRLFATLETNVANAVTSTPLRYRQQVSRDVLEVVQVGREQVVAMLVRRHGNGRVAAKPF
jgi:hypothetical protein